jgi:hypothetical protein
MKMKFIFTIILIFIHLFQYSNSYYLYFDNIRKGQIKQPKGDRFFVYLISEKNSEEKIKKILKSSDDIIGLVDSSDFNFFKQKLEKMHPEVKWVELKDIDKKKEFQSKFNYQSSPILLIAHDGFVSYDPGQSFLSF